MLICGAQAIELGRQATASAEDTVFAFSSDDEAGGNEFGADADSDVALRREADIEHRRALQQRIDELEGSNLAALKKITEAKEELEWYDEALQDEDDAEERAELESKAQEARAALTAAKLEAGNVAARLNALRDEAATAEATAAVASVDADAEGEGEGRARAKVRPRSAMQAVRAATEWS